MRLLNTETLRLETFNSPEAVEYAILSHTWTEHEIPFQDPFDGPGSNVVKGWEKICRSCSVASHLGLAYIWIDTCCIDKSSSAELSEAINSMFQWYEQAKVCIAFLDDVSSADDPVKLDSEFRKCRWFTRGWTLQELIAPSELSFYSKDWEPMGTRTSLKNLIGEITSIPDAVLASSPTQRRAQLDDISVAEKLSWAADRVTTRSEDVAYCLLGIFDINMPLIYGEGRIKAFKRLQEEIIRSTSDDSIYAWRYSKEQAEKQHYWGLLAESPAAFGRYFDLLPRKPRFLARRSNHAPNMSNRGLQVEFAVTPFPNDKSGSIFIAFLDCEMRRDKSATSLAPAILLQKMSWYSDTDFVRIRPDVIALLMMNQVMLPDELMELAKGGSDADAESFPEAEPRQIFVPHHITTLRSPPGIIFHPRIGPPGEKLFIVTVLSRSPTWQLFKDESRPGADEAYVLAFDLHPVPEVSGIHEATMLGALELEVKQPDGWNSWHVCLVAGMEPLAPNAIGTPPLYAVPWYAFEKPDRIAANDLSGVLDGDTRKKVHALLRQTLLAGFDLESRHSRLFYTVSLKLGDVEEEKGKMSLPWRSGR